MFMSNKYARFVAFMDEFQTEAKLAYDNLVNNNLTLAQKHSDEAASIFSWNLKEEFPESDKDISNQLKANIDNLKVFASDPKMFSENITTIKEQKMKIIERLNQVISNIDSNTEFVINATEKRQQIDNSNPINQITNLFTSLLTGKAADPNSVSVHPMRFVELVDNILRNYGDAYDVDFDMTDMAYMTLANNTHSMAMMNNSAKDNNGIENKNYDNAADYQTALGLSLKLSKIFQEDLKPLMKNNESSLSEKTLREGIVEMINSIKNKESPRVVMMIVHTKIHPSLISAFNLKIMSNTEEV